MVIKAKKDKKSGELYLKLSDFKEFVNIKKVKSYTLKEIYAQNGELSSLILKFYDKKGKTIKAKSLDNFKIKLTKAHNKCFGKPNNKP